MDQPQGQLHNQLAQLTQRIESLERLLLEWRGDSHTGNGHLGHGGLYGGTSQAHAYGLVVEHRDILEEGPSGDADQNGHLLPTDMQVSRLMAQLTAAYTRIATLEEQLVACRLHRI